MACIFALFPIYWLVLSSIQKGSGGHFIYPPVFYPDKPTLKSYEFILTSSSHPILLWLRNSFIVAISTAVICVLIASFSAYALSRFEFKGKSIIQQSFLLIRLLPTTLIIIPLFLLMINLKLTDTHISLVLANTSFALPLSIFMLKGYFDTIPIDIEESGLVDGCNRLGVLFKISLPICAPGLAATFLYGFLMGWNEFLFARTFLTNGMLYTASIGMSFFIGQHITLWSELMAAAVLYSLPVSILFLFLQRYMITGLAAGAVKN